MCDSAKKWKTAINAELDDSRRLTGPNWFSTEPGAICDVRVDEGGAIELVNHWSTAVVDLLERLGWSDQRHFSRTYAGGASLAITAPIDVLYAATEVNELALRCALDDTGPRLANEAELTELNAEIEQESNPTLLALAAAASKQQVSILVDDDDTSLGYGASSQSWPTERLPGIDQIDWPLLQQAKPVPVALVTGTNGKSTTVRLLASIIAASGQRAGISSTDYVRVGEKIIDTGDYSGPGGARTVLRHPDTDVAILEVARGGMLRRGLGVTEADVCLITNVAADHLGEYGINTVDELIEAKFIVRRALTNNRPLVLNADDSGVVHFAKTLSEQPIIWFSENTRNALIEQHCDGGGSAWVVANGQLTRLSNGESIEVLPIADIPVTLSGHARHNVQNALAAAAVAAELGVSDQDIRTGLRQFGGSAAENPGRGNLYQGHGVQALVDFAHNEHGLAAVAKTVAAMPAKRRLVMLGQAGDRTDELIEGLVDAALLAKPDKLVIMALPGYERGREAHEVPELIERLALDRGLRPSQLHHADSPIDATRFALDWSEAGDFLLLLALTQREACTRLVRERLES